MPEPVLQVAIATPVMRLFDYLPPADQSVAPRPGQRVSVPFGRSRRVGVIAAVASESELPRERLRRATAILDDEPLLDQPLLELLEWTAAYYQHPPGEVYAAALPVSLRQGDDLPAAATRWFATGAGQATDLQALQRRARLQARLLVALRAAPGGLAGSELSGLGSSWRAALRSLAEGRLAETRVVEEAADALPPAPEAGPILTPDQARAVESIRAATGYQAFLLEGVTGSGKTEVYLECIAAQLARGRQSLVLVPEIGLTPQLLDRFRRRLGVAVAVLHSGLAGGERLRAWQAAASGKAQVIIGTRSAVFTAMLRPGLIIVDEEHDSSLKQQDGLRYSARDLSVWRAHQLGIPVVLGSATPAFESIENARAGRYQRLELPERPGNARHPRVSLIDLRRHPTMDGLSEPLLAAIRRHLQDDGQVLIYLNRRGYAPTLMCAGCGHVAECRRCDARMVYHRARSRLVCHHCGAERPAPQACPDCGAPLHAVGQGTERLETALRELFPSHPLVRIDRDTTRRRGEMERRLEMVRSGEARLLLGTQMLTKGHDFPDVTLVGVIDADQGLFGTDFRSSERLAQSVIQVSGRAGRAEKDGEVMIQTLYPDHPLLTVLVREGYAAFAIQALATRQAAGWPPFGYLALLRAEAQDRKAVFAFLNAATSSGAPISGQLQLLGPAPAAMERRSGRYRGQLMVRADNRGALQRFLGPWRRQLDELPAGRRVRWSLDVDPAELF